MAVSNESLIEIAKSVMLENKNRQHIQSIAEETFKRKGIKFNEKSDEYAQFVIDFMLCGDFIRCTGDEWDLKNRQPKSLQDSEGALRIHDEEIDKEVNENMLSDDNMKKYENVDTEEGEIFTSKNEDNDEDDDDDDEVTMEDDIESALKEDTDYSSGDEN